MSTEFTPAWWESWSTRRPAWSTRRPAWRLVRGDCDVCKGPTHAQHIPTGRHVHLVCWATEREEEAQRGNEEWDRKDRALDAGLDQCPACSRWCVEITVEGHVCRATDCGWRP